MMPPHKLPTNQPHTPANTNKNEALPTEVMPPRTPPTKIYITPEQPPTQMNPSQIPQTQYYSPAKTDPNQVRPTQAVSSNELLPTQFVPSKAVEPVVAPKFENKPPQANTEQPKKKSSKFFKIAAIFLLLLLLGGGVAAYFLVPPMQSSKSYNLTDKHQTQDNTLQFDNQSKTLFMVAASNDDFQKWQITPDANDKFYYRFVNRGLGESNSLEIIDDNQDSSVTMAQSAKDVGQLWAITNVQGDYYRITNQWLGDSKSLSHIKQYYTFLRIKDSNSNDSQLWKKISAQNGQGFYLVNKQYGESVYLQALTKDEFKDKLIMKSGEQGNRQWEITDLGTGFFTIKTTADGKSLDINPNKKENIIMATTGNSAAQRWKMTPAGNDYFRLTNESLGDGKSLEAVTFSKYTVEMVKSSDTDLGQLWKITKIK